MLANQALDTDAGARRRVSAAALTVKMKGKIKNGIMP